MRSHHDSRVRLLVAGLGILLALFVEWALHRPRLHAVWNVLIAVGVVAYSAIAESVVQRRSKGHAPGALPAIPEAAVASSADPDSAGANAR